MADATDPALDAQFAALIEDARALGLLADEPVAVVEKDYGYIEGHRDIGREYAI